MKLSPGSISVGQYKEVEKIATSIHLKLLGQGSNKIKSKSRGLIDAVGIVLKKMPVSDIVALKKEKCEEGKRRTEDCKKTLKEAVRPKQLKVKKLQDDLVESNKALMGSLMLLSGDKKALAQKFINNKAYKAFDQHSQIMQNYFPANYKTFERANNFGSKVYHQQRVLNDDEQKWIDIGWKFEKVLRDEKKIDVLTAEIKRLERVKTDGLNFPKITVEQANLFPKSDYPREEIVWAYDLKALVARRLKAQK